MVTYLGGGLLSSGGPKFSFGPALSGKESNNTNSCVSTSESITSTVELPIPDRRKMGVKHF